MTIPNDLLRTIDQVAKAEGRTRSGLIREAVRQYVDNRLAEQKRSSRLLSRLASEAVAGPNLDAATLEQVLYRGRRS